MPIAPVPIGVILGPLAETEFRLAVSDGEGDPLVFITSPFPIALSSVLNAAPERRSGAAA